MKQFLLLLFVFVLINAEGCQWANNVDVCGTEVDSSLIVVPDCWTCPNGQLFPNDTDRLVLAAPNVTRVVLNSPVSLLGLEVVGAPLVVSSTKLVLFDINVKGASATFTNVMMENPYKDSSNIAITVEGPGLVIDSVNASITLNANCIANFTGASNLMASEINLLKDSFFIGNFKGYWIDLHGGVFQNYGKATFCEPANTVFEIRGTSSTDHWMNRNGSMITIGQSPVYGEVDMNLMVTSEPASSIVVNEYKYFAPQTLLSTGSMLLTGSLRLEYGMVALLERANLAPSSTGLIEVYGDGMIGFSRPIVLPLASLNVAAGGTIEVIGVDNNHFANMSFKYVSVVDGLIQNNPINVYPIPSMVTAETITLVRTRINMFNESCTMTINGNSVYIGEKLNLLDDTVLVFPKGAIQLEANISGSSQIDRVEFGTATSLTMYFWGYKWNHTEIKIAGKVDFHAIDESSWTGAFVNATTSNITIAGATVAVHLNTPPKRWGDFALISTASITGTPASTTVDGDYSCLGGTVAVSAKGLILSQRPPAMASPTNLQMVNSGSSSVIRFDGVASLPCYMNVAGYTVAIGNDTYDILQRALVVDSNIFPACQVFQAQAALRIMSNFTPVLTATGPMSAPLSFANIPVPPMTSDLHYEVSKDKKSATIKFGSTAASACACSSLQRTAYYQVTYHGKTTNVTEAQVTLENIMGDDADVGIKTVCEYNLDPRIVSSASYPTRISLMDGGDTIVKNNNDLSGGQIAGLVIGLIACFAVGIIIGVLVAKRTFTRMSHESSNNL